MPRWHEENPWGDCAVYVPHDELAAALAGGTVRMPDGSTREIDAGYHLERWASAGRETDAYILPPQEYGHSVGVRYGPEPADYLSPAARDMAAVAALYEKYAPGATPGP